MPSPFSPTTCWRGSATWKRPADLAEIGIDTSGSRATVVARLEPSASVRPDEPIELAVDLRQLHFFDLGSGETIGA